MAPRFPNARYLINRHDWEGNPDREQPDSQLMIRLGPIERRGLLDLVDGDHEVASGVTMLHTPGESPGHSVVRVASGDELFYALGDLIHHPAHVEHLDWMDSDYPGRDVAAMQRSRERVFVCETPGTCIHRGRNTLENRARRKAQGWFGGADWEVLRQP